MSEQPSCPEPGTWAHTVNLIKSLPIDELRAGLRAARDRRSTSVSHPQSHESVRVYAVNGEYVAADDGGWIEGVFASREEALEAALSDPPRRNIHAEVAAIVDEELSDAANLVGPATVSEIASRLIAEICPLLVEAEEAATEWEYGVVRHDGAMVNNADYTIQQTHRRRKAGPWMPVSDPQRKVREW